jgi:hypothetical protein
LRQSLRERVDQAVTDYEARRGRDNELRPQQRSTQVIAGDRHRLKVFRAEGLRQPDIARQAGVFPSQLGYYFGTKEALFVEAACRDVLHLASQVENAAARTRTPATYVRALVRTALAGSDVLR